MNKSRGRKIILEFDKDLVGDIAGNVNAFTVTGQQPYPLPDGPPQEATFAVESVNRPGVSILYEELFVAGVFSGTKFKDGLILAAEEGSGSVEDVFDTSVTDTYGSNSVKGQLVKFNSGGTLSAIKIKSLASGVHATTVKTAYNGTTLATGSASASARGEWLTLTLNNTLSVSINGTLYVEFTHPSTSSYFCPGVNHNGPLWLSQGVYIGTWTGAAYTFAIGLVFTESSYVPIGTYIPPAIDATNFASSVRVVFSGTTPATTTFSVSYGFNDNDGIPPLTWAVVDTNSAIEIGGSHLWFRYTLETENVAETPVLTELFLEEAHPPQNKIELHFADANRFADVRGGLTVTYNASIGNLTGVLPVVSFSESFAPGDLTGSPVHKESVTSRVLSASVSVTAVTYDEGQSPGHQVIGSVYSVSVSVIPV